MNECLLSFSTIPNFALRLGIQTFTHDGYSLSHVFNYSEFCPSVGKWVMYPLLGLLVVCFQLFRILPFGWGEWTRI